MLKIQPVNIAHQNLYRLVDEVNQTHTPVMIQAKSNNAVLIAESDWWAIQQTLNLSANPELKAQIQQGLQASLSTCQDETS